MNKTRFSIAVITLAFALPLSTLHADRRLDGEVINPLLKQAVTQAILPLYDELDKQAQRLQQATQKFCASPNKEGLNMVESSWRKTLSGWEQSSALLFGPAIENQIDFTIYFRPVKKAVVKSILKKAETTPDQPLDTKTIQQAGVGGQGLATVEYLLFDRDKNEEERVNLFNQGQNEKQRCAYLMAASTLLVENIKTIHQGWLPENGNYAKAFHTAGTGSAQFTAAYQPLELLVNRIHQAIQAVEIKKLGVPLGLRGSRSGPPRAYPYKLEAWRSGTSWQNIQSALQGLQRLLKAGGILKTLDSIDEGALAGKIESQLAALLETELASDDLFQLLQNNPDDVKAFYEQVKIFATTIRTELAPALGVQLGFNQNDGD